MVSTFAILPAPGSEIVSQYNEIGGITFRMILKDFCHIHKEHGINVSNIHSISSLRMTLLTVALNCLSDVCIGQTGILKTQVFRELH